jgi:formylglycine-generating enzyme required for sulfatase activity
MGRNPSRWKGPRNSAEMMTWTEANEFCRRITLRLHEAGRIGPNEVIRLPSEAEWEYCCRAGTTTAYSFGEHATRPGDEGPQASLLDAYAWHTGNAAGNDPPVGALKPNSWGLYDMHGYLWEYTADDWHDIYTNAPADGSAWTGSSGESAPIVLRGGSWKDAHPQLRSAARRPAPRDARNDAVGFRCVRASE